MGEFSKLPNIGPVVEEQLIEADIGTAEQLRQLGSREAWLRIRANDPSACIHRLYALEGAIRGMPKKELPDQVKAELKQFYRSVRG